MNVWFMDEYLSTRYEGTGRSLSLKLIQQLRDQQVTHSRCAVFLQAFLLGVHNACLFRCDG